MKTIIIDDEPDSLRLLARQIGKHCPELDIVAACNTPEEGIAAIGLHRPALLFLDIEMPRINGFELLERLAPPHPFHLVFTTAYDRYAVRAFRFNALDYLLKPIDEQELISAVTKARAHSHLQPEQLAEAKKWMQNTTTKPEKIAVSHRDQFKLVVINDILYCESDRSYTTLHLKTGEKHLLTRALGEIEDMLAEVNFFRIHKQFIINIGEVQHYSKGESATVTLTGGQHLPISRYRLEAFKRLFL